MRLFMLLYYFRDYLAVKYYYSVSVRNIELNEEKGINEIQTIMSFNFFEFVQFDLFSRIFKPNLMIITIPHLFNLRIISFEYSSNSHSLKSHE
jgi:hypothetical protein